MSHAYLCGSVLRVALELRNSQPQSVLRLCVFSGQRFRIRDIRPRTQTVFCGQEFCGFKLTFRRNEMCRFFFEKNSSYRPRPRCGDTPKFRWPPNLHTRAVPIGTIKMRARYSCGAAIQCQKQQPNCPPTRSYISYLI